MRTVRLRFWFEAIVAAVAATLAVVTIFWRDWIEVTGWDPDRHSGALEWAVVGILAGVAILSALRARVEWRRPLAVT